MIEGILLTGIILLVILLAGFLTVGQLQKRTRRRALESQRQAGTNVTRTALSDLLTRAQQGDTTAGAELRRREEADAALIHDEPADSELADKYHRVMADLAHWEWRASQEARLVGLLSEYQQAGSLPDQIDALARLLAFRDEWNTYSQFQREIMQALATIRQLDAEQARIKLARLIHHRYAELVVLAPTDEPALRELQQLINHQTHHGTPISVKMGAPELTYPTDWNLWVSRLYLCPTLQDFAGLEGAEQVPAGQLSRRASETLEAEEGGIRPAVHLMQAQILLAYDGAGADFLSTGQRDDLSHLVARLKLADSGQP